MRANFLRTALVSVVVSGSMVATAITLAFAASIGRQQPDTNQVAQEAGKNAATSPSANHREERMRDKVGQTLQIIQQMKSNPAS